MATRFSLMQPADIEAIIAIEQASFTVPWGINSFLSEINNPLSLNIVMKLNDSLEHSGICAYSCCQMLYDELSILKIAVSPAKRRLGLGKQLLETVLGLAADKGAQKAFLEVRPSNRSALALYRGSGFSLIGRRPDYYPETREDALVMMKIIKETS